MFMMYFIHFILTAIAAIFGVLLLLLLLLLLQEDDTNVDVLLYSCNNYIILKVTATAAETCWRELSGKNI